MTDPETDAPTGSRTPDLAERYGRSRALPHAAGGTDRPADPRPDLDEDPWDESDGIGPRPRLSVGARIAVWAALAAAVAVAAWFTVVDTQRDPVSFVDVGFSVTGPEEVEVTFDVSMPPGTGAVCTITALNRSFAEVGALDVEVAPQEARTTRHTATVATTELATTGVVDHCRVA